MRGLGTSLTILTITAFSLPAIAEPSPVKQKDPNEVVCEKIETIGSRVSTKRVCGTRAEWAEKRKLDREAVDQAQRAANGPCQTVNTHTGAPAC